MLSRLQILFGFLSLCACLTFGNSPLQASDESPAMGINFSGIADWSSELPFTNVFFSSRTWISQQKGASWGKGPTLELDAHGWVRKLEKNCWAETPLCTIDGGHYPSGIWTVRYEGNGKLAFTNARILTEKKGEIQIEVNSQHGAFWLQIHETDPKNYIRNIQILMPGMVPPEHEGKKAQNSGRIWNPEFLAKWRGTDTVRFMDLQATNGSTLEKWSDRPVLGDATFAPKGLPLELLCDLANQLGANAWFCVPHRADDDFVRRMAETIRRNLRPNLKVYVEYSNEVWNGQFAQCRYAQEQGRALLPDGKPWECGWAWTSFRSKEIFSIFEDVFGDRSRLVRVLATQAVNPYVSEKLLEFADVGKSTDALAIAPYVMWCVPKELADEFVAQGVEGALHHLEKESLPQAIEAMKKQKEVTDAHGLKLVCYEAGQHLVGLWGANDCEKLNEICREANASERMGKIYETYFRAWEECGGGLLCHFSSTGQWSKWGCWGLLRFEDESPETSPKFQAFQKALRRWNLSQKTR